MKKTFALCSAVLLALGSFPMTSFADEMNQQGSEPPTEEINPAPEETGSSDTSEPGAPEESTEMPEIPSVDPVPEQPITPPTTEDSGNTTEPSGNQPEQSESVPEEVEIFLPETQEQHSTTDTQSQTETVITVDYSTIHFDKNTSTETFVATIGESARKVAKENDLFASVMIAQAILESGSGGSLLSQEPYFNLFGIKGEYEGRFVTLATSEDDGAGNLYSIDAAFRSYPSYKESFEDYAALLKDGLTWNEAFYQGTWKSIAGSYQQATQALTGTYATDTSYNLKLNGLIETYNLTQYDREKNQIDASETDFPAYDGVNYDQNNSYAVGQCTQYAYNRVIQLGGHVDLDMGNGQDWDNTAVSRGYQVSHTPTAGTVVSFNAGVLQADPTYGHVAFCERVNEDGSILISEMNAEGLGIVSFRTIPVEYTGMLAYITPK